MVVGVMKQRQHRAATVVVPVVVAMMVVALLLCSALVKLEGHLAIAGGAFATRGGKVAGMRAEVLEKFVAGRATNFKQHRETLAPVVRQEAALTARIRLRALHRMARTGLSKLRASGDVILRSFASASRALRAPLFGDAEVLASRKALLALPLHKSRRLIVVILISLIITCLTVNERVVVTVVVTVVVMVTVRPVSVVVVVPEETVITVELTRSSHFRDGL